MLTDSEKKAFKLLCGILATYDANKIQYPFEIDDSYVREGDFEDFSVSNFDVVPYRGGNTIMLPASIEKEISNFYNRVGKKILMGGMENLIDSLPEDPSYARAYMQFDSDDFTLMLNGYATYPGAADTESSEYDIENLSDDVKQLQTEYPGLRGFRIDYSGGGDSGYVEDWAYGNNDISFDAPENFKDFIYDKLPGGWEINEGSAGSMEFDLENMTATLNHTEYYEDDRSDTFLEVNL